MKVALALKSIIQSGLQMDQRKTISEDEDQMWRGHDVSFQIKWKIVLETFLENWQL